MITTYLKLDLYKNSDYIDSIDMETNEEIFDLLSDFNDSEVNIVRFYLVADLGSDLYDPLEEPLCVFKKIKLKGKGYNWIVGSV
ncbi:MAG: hypothetical protein RL008_312 [Actinomycetota bacterium]|jgi:hypothetical protein